MGTSKITGGGVEDSGLALTASTSNCTWKGRRKERLLRPEPRLGFRSMHLDGYKCIRYTRVAVSWNIAARSVAE